jgi:hypothetical protein
MRVDEAFDIFQGKIDARPDHVRKARHRRDLFSDAFIKLEDVRQVIPSGSLARSTQLDPIHDVDLIVVFDAAAHPEWGESGSSAETALSYLQDRVLTLLGSQASIARRVVGDTLIRNHVVKCFLDPRFLAQDPDFKGFFAVEVMPALRTADGVLLIPERKKERWQKADPEWLIAEVRRRQEQWPYFVRMIRVIKFWMRHVDSGVKPLAAEVLALTPQSGTFTGSRSVALQRFFTAASGAVMLPVTDPAGYCGAIQPGLDHTKASGLLGEAGGLAAKAVTWEQRGEHHQAICCWRAVFGREFPAPPGGCPGWGNGGGGGGSDSGDGGQPKDNRPPGDGDDGPSGGPSSPGPGDGPGDGGGAGDRGGGPTLHGPAIPPGVPPSPRGPVKDAPQG